jgi:hypothetical protein
MYTDQKEFNYE